MTWRGCYNHDLEFGTPAWDQAVAELIQLSERAKVAFEDAGGACPTCFLALERRLAELRTELHQLRGDLSEAADRTAPGDQVVRWAAGQDQCPNCSMLGGLWPLRTCCELSRAVGRWEATQVAERLMEKDLSSGGPADDGTVNAFGVPRPRRS